MQRRQPEHVVRQHYRLVHFSVFISLRSFLGGRQQHRQDTFAECFRIILHRNETRKHRSSRCHHEHSFCVQQCAVAVFRIFQEQLSTRPTETTPQFVAQIVVIAQRRQQSRRRGTNLGSGEQLRATGHHPADPPFAIRSRERRQIRGGAEDRSENQVSFRRPSTRHRRPTDSSSSSNRAQAQLLPTDLEKHGAGDFEDCVVDAWVPGATRSCGVHRLELSNRFGVGAISSYIRGHWHRNGSAEAGRRK